MDDVVGAAGALGAILVAVGLVVVLMTWGGLDERMPSQVPPRRLGVYTLVAGALLIVVARVGLVIPGG